MVKGQSSAKADDSGALGVKGGGVQKPDAPAPPKRPEVRDPVPEGWLNCPPMGKPLDGLIPIKVPLGSNFDRYLEPGRRFRPGDVVRMLAEKGMEAGLVIDLTNSHRYYQVEEWAAVGLRHQKIPCRGRGETPDELAVNHFVWEVTKFQRQEQAERRGQTPRYILVHCTHGHNRTGFMIAHFMMRSMSCVKVKHAVGKFAAHRPPGIYKEDYLATLFKYYHEKREPQMACPGTPEWKKGEDEEDGEDAILEARAGAGEGEGAGAGAGAEAHMTHEDEIGEEVPPEYADLLRNVCVMGVTGSDQQGSGRFPGSQPVSLERKNMNLLEERLYYVTWKADGTRYMLLLMRDGVYLIDRSFRVRRTQMQFPKAFDPKTGNSMGPHHMTLLDGEMVVDEDMETGKQMRRFLVYDIMMLNERPVVHETFGRRFEMILKHVTGPKSAMKQHPEWARFYRFDQEPFSVRRKDFWLLSQARKLLEDFIPNIISHESDGLIFQGWEDPYVPDTCQELLKWKFASMNSVDFRLKKVEGRWRLFVMDAPRGQGPRDLLLDGVADGEYEVSFPEGTDPEELEGEVVECAWDGERRAWTFMRTRPDKETPNHVRVYHRVVQSIEDNITDEVILEYVEEVTKNELYQKHIAEATRGRGH